MKIDTKSALTVAISINGETIEIAIHPDYDYCAADRLGNAYIRPAVRAGIPKGMTYPRAAHWVMVKPHPCIAKTRQAISSSRLASVRFHCTASSWRVGMAFSRNQQLSGT